MKDFIMNMAREAGDIALSYIGKAAITKKGEKDNVTEADKAVEKFIIGKIANTYPDHHIISEESGDLKKESEYTWYIDPIDGTHNYSHSDMHFCVSIGVSGKSGLKYGCVYLPAIDRMYFAEKGKGAEMDGKKISVSKISNMEKAMVNVGLRLAGPRVAESFEYYNWFAMNADRARDYGFCAAEMCFLAEGSADGIVKLSQHVWDIAAGILIMEEAGAIITDFEGNKIRLDKIDGYDVVAANKGLHKQIIGKINELRR